ncbi:hypothetical protein BDN72DRAFT_787894 [Pluteus cervinus]|uniref:Uncharacterized protein n=1 Tax=Pluteus cervinus TaxID=181527 RepID=A0ACD3BAZ2_9AGAR|nr:hypothetical protein BDN72DRAFT_787894 [Pluteus cervinus]
MSHRLLGRILLSPKLARPPRPIPLNRPYHTGRSNLRSNPRRPHIPCCPPLCTNFGLPTTTAFDWKSTNGRIENVAAFHSTSRREIPPLIPLLATVFKASTSLEVARTAARIGLTFFPLLFFTKVRNVRHIKIADVMGNPLSAERKSFFMRKIRISSALLNLIFLVPFSLFALTLVGSLEQTPLTGRWRLILLSPEEEDEIAAQLAGPGWYNAVTDIIAQEGQPRFIPPSDWRYTWVNDTLRKLETTIPILIREPELCPNWVERGPDDRPMPPPATYPLTPRPRGTEYLRSFCHKIHKNAVSPTPHVVTGPPYSLLIVEKPSANAFSYGFGPDGGGGIVVHSGFLDEVFAKHPFPEAPPPEQSGWSAFFGGLFSSPARPRVPTPTPEQTSELAILLAHELAHLLLSHHLETLSSSTVIVPGTLSIVTDVLRVIIFPFTMIFGPFVNDALAQLGKVGSGEFAKLSEHCTSVPQEIEADVVSARLLAHAGFDARDALKFWETRGTAAECSNIEPTLALESERSTLVMRITGNSHPVNTVRVEKLKEELERWETERRVALSHMQAIGEPLLSSRT